MAYGRVNVGGFGELNTLRGFIPIYFQETPPVTNREGAIWIKSNIVPNGRRFIGFNNMPDSYGEGDLWLRSMTGAGEVKDFYLELSSKEKILYVSKGNDHTWNVYDDNNLTIKMPVPNASLLYENGAWKGKESYIYLNNSWVKFMDAIDFIYSLGTEFIPLSLSGQSTSGTLRFDKEQERLRFYVSTGAITGYVWAKTDTRINLSGVQGIEVEWECIEALQGNASRTVLAVDTQTNDYHPNQMTTLSDAHLVATNAFGRRIDYLDVSSLVGDFTIRVGVWDATSSSNVTESFVYSIRLVYG